MVNIRKPSRERKQNDTKLKHAIKEKDWKRKNTQNSKNTSLNCSCCPATAPAGCTLGAGGAGKTGSTAAGTGATVVQDLLKPLNRRPQGLSEQPYKKKKPDQNFLAQEKITYKHEARLR